jgi:hypothetical protein
MQGTDGSTHVPVEEPKDALDAMFTYHAATPQQEQDYRAIRGAALSLARVIDRCCPAGPDRTTAIRKLREAVMTANASISTNNAIYR